MFVFLILIFFITRLKNVSISEFLRLNFTFQNVRKYRELISPRPILSFLFCYPNFAIQIFPSGFYHRHFSLRIFPSAIRHPPSAAIRSALYSDSLFSVSSCSSCLCSSFFQFFTGPARICGVTMSHTWILVAGWGCHSNVLEIKAVFVF